MRLKNLIVLVVVASFGALTLEIGQAYGQAFGIDYANPSAYLEPGSQTTLSSSNREAIHQQLGGRGRGLDDVKAIFKWKKDNFKTEHAKGAHLGSRTVNDSMKTKLLTGCNDHANMLAAVLRMHGIPAIVVNAAGIQWARDFVKRKKGPGGGRRGKKEDKGFKGHAFVEAYVEGKWILINSTSGQYVARNYDPTNPVIPIQAPVEPVGYYSYSKGLDQASCGVHSMKDSRKKMLAIAPIIARSSIVMPPYKIENLVPLGKKRRRQ